MIEIEDEVDDHYIVEKNAATSSSVNDNDDSSSDNDKFVMENKCMAFTELPWFTDYLTSRLQHIKFNNDYSQ